mgnify:CR=1 FL=1
MTSLSLPKIFTLSLWLSCSTLPSSQITLSSQAEVDAWDSSITILNENLTITGSDITNTDALSNLTQIQGTLNIQFNDILENTDGLTNLDSISGSVSIRSNNKGGTGTSNQDVFIIESLVTGICSVTVTQPNGDGKKRKIYFFQKLIFVETLKKEISFNTQPPLFLTEIKYFPPKMPKAGFLT